MMDIEYIRVHAWDSIPQFRRAHVAGVVETALMLVEIYGEDAVEVEAAALLHDCTKSLKIKEQLKFADEHGIILGNNDLACPQVIHAITGAVRARECFHVTDTVAEAIRVHTFGKPNMATLDKIIMLADKTERTREFPSVDKLRSIMELSLDEAVFEFIKGLIEYHTAKDLPLHHDTMDVYDYYR